MSVDFTLNGAPVSVSADHPHLLAALREELDVTSPKDGCSPSGQCGCCTVLVDGKAVVSCNLTLDKVAGKSVVTLEGVDADERDRFAEAFAACGGLQCGFCIPGIVMRAKSQIDKKGADLDRTTMAPHLGAHLCRCTGLRQDPRRDRGGRQGQVVRAPRWRRASAQSGAKYEAGELRPRRPRLRRRHPRARACSTPRCTSPTTPAPTSSAIDTSAAAAAAGVVGVFTAADIPGELRVGIIYKDWPVMIPVGGRTSYAGDVLAIVVAETREQARAAAAPRRRSTTTCCRPVTDPLAAVEPGAEIAVWGTDDNVLSRSVYARGDVDGALAASAHTVHEVFQTQRIEHAFLEPESTLAVPADDPGTASGRCTSTPAGRACGTTATTSAACSPSPTDRVTVELVSNGGAFGGKEDMSNQAHAALAAWLLERPVKCTLSREESFRMHAKRHPIRLEYWAGCDADGMLTAVRVRAVGDSGAYAVGRDEGARAGRRPRHRAVPRAGGRRGGDRGPHQQPRCAGRSAASVPTRRSSPWTACSTGSPTRSASAAGRSASAT